MVMVGGVGAFEPPLDLGIRIYFGVTNRLCETILCTVRRKLTRSGMHVVGSPIGSISATMNFCSTIGINSLLLLGFLQGVEAGDSKTLTFLPELPSRSDGGSPNHETCDGTL
jgi:hypothetical protein